MYGEEASVAAGVTAMSLFSESEGDNADAVEQGGVEANLDGDHDAVIQDQTNSAWRLWSIYWEGGSSSTWLDKEGESRESATG